MWKRHDDLEMLKYEKKKYIPLLKLMKCDIILVNLISPE